MTTLETLPTEPRPISATGNEQAIAYDERFALVRERLLRICTGLVGVDAAEDVVQDAYLRGRQRIGQLRDIDLFDGWVTRIAVNLCINRHRSGGRLRALLARVAEPPAGASTGRDVALRELIERLPPRERTLIVLHYGHGYRIDEIARMTGQTAVNARSVIFRARQRLADQLRGRDR